MKQVMLSRREALRISLASSALLLITGCSSLRKSESEQDKAFRKLRSTLDSLAGDTEQQARLISIAERIERTSRDLIIEHDDFLEQFEGAARKRETESATLATIVAGFDKRRARQRNDLLQIQDELRAELTEQEWALAIEALNRKTEAIKRPQIGSG